MIEIRTRFNCVIVWKNNGFLEAKAGLILDTEKSGGG